MADTPMSLADMILPEVFYAYTQQYSTIQTDFWRSGIVQDFSAIIGDLGGTTVHMPFFNALKGSSVVVADTERLQINKTSTSMDVAVRQYRAMTYGSHDLAADLAGADPMLSIMNGLGQLWAEDFQQNLLSVVKGAMASLAAETADATNHNSASPNNYDISANAAAAGVIDGVSILDAVQRLGDHGEVLAGMAMHSATLTTLKKNDLIDYMRDSEGGRPLPYYMGKRVIVTDEMPITGSGSNAVYTTYLFGPGAIGYAEKPTKNPVDVWRDPLEGGGLDYIVQRRQFALHPRGIKWIGTPASDGKTPSNTELANAANWDRVVDNKLIKIVAFKHRVA